MTSNQAKDQAFGKGPSYYFNEDLISGELFTD